MKQSPSVATDSRPPAPALRPSRARRWRTLWVTLAALFALILTLRLGWWQLNRAQEKEQRAAVLAERSAAPALAGDSLFTPQAQHQPDELLHRRIGLTGHWLATHTVFLDNRQMNGKPGFFVFTPLRLDTPAAQVVLVQRGWVPRNFADRTALPPIATPPGLVQLQGRIAPAPSKLLALGRDLPLDAPQSQAAGRIRQNLDLAAFRAQTGLPLSELTVVQTDAPSDGLLRDWLRPQADVAKHHGYAFQWFGLATLIAVLYVWFQLVRPQRQRRPRVPRA